MPAASQGLTNLRTYLLNEHPDTISSANSLARRFGVEPNSAARALQQAGYTKNESNPKWHAPTTSVSKPGSAFTVNATAPVVEARYKGLSPELFARYTVDGKVDGEALKQDWAELTIFLWQRAAHLIITEDKVIKRD